MVRAGAAAWPALARAARLVHGDFGPTNLLVRAERAGWAVTGVLDWEFAHAGHPAMDVGNLLRARPEGPLPEGFAVGLEDGLRAGGAELDPDWRAHAEYVDLFSALEFLSSVAERPATHARARRQVEATVARW